MKQVDIMFYNLQSHENTSFTLYPGMNFILSEGNNVGKSTIMRVLHAACEMPSPFMPLRSLLRTNTTQGFAAFKFDNTSITFWLVKENDKTVIGFFEIDKDGIKTRSPKCPQMLLDALGVTLGHKGNAMNFNSADTVQLLATDSAENDAIVSKILIDEKVEGIKAGMCAMASHLPREVQRTNDILAYNLQQLESLNYNTAVEQYEAERESLGKLAALGDGLCNITNDLSPDILKDIVLCNHALNVSSVLFKIDLQKEENPLQVEIPVDTIGAALRFSVAMSRVDLAAFDKRKEIKLDVVDSKLELVTCVLSAIQFCQRSASAQKNSAKLSQELSTVYQELLAVTIPVKCPMKGEVLYSNEKCISLGARLAPESK